MPLNLNKLEKVVNKPDGKIEARCPACAEQGDDKTGNHLVVYPDGRFGCVANPGDKDHSRAILRLAGGDFAQLPETPRLKINRLHFPPIQTILVLPRPCPPVIQETVDKEPLPEPVMDVEASPPKPEFTPPKSYVFPEGMSEEVKAFLLRKK